MKSEYSIYHGLVYNSFFGANSILSINSSFNNDKNHTHYQKWLLVQKELAQYKGKKLLRIVKVFLIEPPWLEPFFFFFF